MHICNDILYKYVHICQMGMTMEEVRAVCEELIKESEIRSVVVGPKGK